MKYTLFSLFFLALLFTACEGDDEGMPLVYELCSTSFTFLESEKSNTTALNIDETPSNIRSYIASEFAGIGIKSVASFDVNSNKYLEITANNDGKMLFDGEGTFLCADDSFSMGNDDDDDDYGGHDDDDE